jgi:thiamine biosynthesis lipoprotein
MTTVSAVASLMGGTVGIHVRGDAGVSGEAARRDALRVLARLEAWARRLTRFSDGSDLAFLNARPEAWVRVRPTLAAALEWGRRASDLTGGVVDITLLQARLDAEAGQTTSTAEPRPGGPWSIRHDRRGATVSRGREVRFDLDGIGKGWLADRAAALLPRHPAVVVDADGDLAVSLRFGETWRLQVADPVDPTAAIATLDLTGLAPNAISRFGLATSGTSVHRWAGPHGDRHHLIDPRTGRPAVTDVVQATVLAGSAAEAEAFAKTVVILGSDDALGLLDRPGPCGAILVTNRGTVLATPAFTRWLG